MTETDGPGRVIRTIPADTFGHRLMLVRAHFGHLNVKGAAEKCGLNYGSWSNWERGSLPRDILDVAEAIAEGLGVDRDWLLHGGPLAPPVRSRRVRSTYARRSLRPGGHATERRARRIVRERVPA